MSRVFRSARKGFFFSVVALSAICSPALGGQIDNSIPSGTVGHLKIDVDTGGETRNGELTAHGLQSNTNTTGNVIFDYFSYVDTGSGGVRLSGSVPTGDNHTQQSNGTFTGSGGNTISWSVSSALPANSKKMTNTLTFTTTSGTLGNLKFYQYLDEDVLDESNGVFFTRGSLANKDLELFTIDNTEVFGVSQSGAFGTDQGLVNANFDGFAVDEYNNMKPMITAGTQNVSLTGTYSNSLTALNHPEVGSGFGPQDIVSTLRWSVDPTSNTATIVTTLGGIPDVTVITPGGGGGNPVPLPLGVWAGVIGLGMAATARKKILA